MDVTEMVEELIEKRLSDWVSEHTDRSCYRMEDIDAEAKKIVGEKVDEKMRAKREEILKAVERYFDKCDVRVEVGGYRGLEVSISAPEEEKEVVMI